MGLYQQSLRSYEENFFANVAIAVIAQSCLGAIAAMYILQNGTSFLQMTQLFVVIALCMAHNGAVLSNQKPKMIFNILLVNVVVNSIIAIINMAM